MVYKKVNIETYKPTLCSLYLAAREVFVEVPDKCFELKNRQTTESIKYLLKPSF